MQLSTLVYAVQVVFLCMAAMADGRPVAEDGGRQRRSSGRCQPKNDSPDLQQRTLCPFKTTSSLVFAGLDVEVKTAELDPECTNSYCGDGGRGVCSPVFTKITYGNFSETVTLAFVCADEGDAEQGHKTTGLSYH